MASKNGGDPKEPSKELMEEFRKHNPKKPPKDDKPKGDKK